MNWIASTVANSTGSTVALASISAMFALSLFNMICFTILLFKAK